jgi:hypothetical protein
MVAPPVCTGLGLCDRVGCFMGSWLPVPVIPPGALWVVFAVRNDPDPCPGAECGDLFWTGDLCAILTLIVARQTDEGIEADEEVAVTKSGLDDA